MLLGFAIEGGWRMGQVKGVPVCCVSRVSLYILLVCFECVNGRGVTGSLQESDEVNVRYDRTEA